MPVLLIVYVVCGTIAAVIASNKGRSAAGWFFGGFFLTWVGIVIVACLSNLKEQGAYRARIESERRRLREQLRQERLKGEAYRQYSMGRLDAHDDALGIDTRSPQQVLPNVEPAGFLEQGVVNPTAQNAAWTPTAQNAAAERVWYYELDGVSVGPVSEMDVQKLLNAKMIGPNTLLWAEGFVDWTPAAQVDRFTLPMG